MGGRVKEGIDYAGWAVDVFEDPKIERLLDGAGAAGFTVYFYLCQRAFRSCGYYLPWAEEDAVFAARRIGGGMDAETVGAVVRLCLELELFHRGLWESRGVLTSRGMQRSFVPVIKRRKLRTVCRELWLLEPEESMGICFPDGASEE